MTTDIEPEGVPPDAVVRSQKPLTRVRIETVDDYERATARVAELAGQIGSSSEKRELEALVEAIMEWDKAHDDATAWR